MVSMDEEGVVAKASAYTFPCRSFVMFAITPRQVSYSTKPGSVVSLQIRLLVRTPSGQIAVPDRDHE